MSPNAAVLPAAPKSTAHVRHTRAAHHACRALGGDHAFLAYCVHSVRAHSRRTNR